MKTEKLYESDAYISRFEATVLSCENADGVYKTVLSKTAFFPEGGGQPADIGKIDGIPVFDVKIENGEIYHYTKTPLAKGKKAAGEIDFDRRFNFMQNHTAEHIVSGLVYKKFGFDNIGFHLNENEVSFDFNGFFTSEQLRELELEANKRVWRNLKVSAYYPAADELGSISYRAKSGIEGEIRLVTIEDTDVCACCAPHVKSTGEIGLIKFLATEKQHGGTRIFMKSGGFALLDYASKTDDIKTICEALSAKPHEAARAVLALNARLDAQKQYAKDLSEQLNYYRIKFFDKSKAAISVAYADIKDLQPLADSLHKTYGGVRTALSKNECGAVFVMCGAADKLEVAFNDLRQKFSIKGGGRDQMRQGSIIAPFDEILEYFGVRETL